MKLPAKSKFIPNNFICRYLQMTQLLPVLLAFCYLTILMVHGIMGCAVPLPGVWTTQQETLSLQRTCPQEDWLSLIKCLTGKKETHHNIKRTND